MDPSPSEMSYEERLARSTAFLQLLLEQSQTYHDHKENMAHAGFLIQVGSLAAVATANEIPPAWMSEVDYSRALLTAGVVTTWLTVNLFVRWQLRNRRHAALLTAATLSVLRDWAVQRPSIAELEPAASAVPGKREAETRETLGLQILSLVDHVLPVPKGVLHSDLPHEMYPVGLNQRLSDQRKAGTGAVRGEWLLFVMGIGVLAVTVWRIWI